MVDIPLEIWFNIAHFIPAQDLLRLMSLNRVFFYVAMDIRYKGVTIPTKTGTESKQLLTRLSDPFVSSRVRHLSLVLYAKPQSMVPNPGRFMYLRTTHGQQSITDTVMFFRLGQQISPTHPQSPDFEDLLGEFIAGSSDFSNINGFTIKTWYMPSAYNLSAIYSSIWSAFGSKLQKLCLEGNLEHYRLLVDSRPSLPVLKELNIDFDRNSFHHGRIANNALSDIITFLNGLSSHLEVLRIRSWFALDISDLLAPLPIFPKLVHLEVNVTFMSCRDPAGLQNFIYHLSHTVRKINLRINPSQSFVNSLAFQPSTRWFLTCVEDDECFSQLRTIDIYLIPTIGNGLMDIAAAFIRRASSSLGELGIHERNLSEDDAMLLIDALSGCTTIRSLHLSVLNITIELIDKLASSTPGLQRLWISVEGAFDNAEAEGGHATFLRELQTRSYPDWKLEDLSVMQNKFRLREVNHDTMMAFSRSIPSLFSFFGNGHIDRTATSGDI
ncbi:hypothetical protein JR316_0005790 [Psilocybe cubensis]|uniref:Uncharacterized protein n=2 Tax=Psilocybe cubensis TaxID=181762 RepID=A0ACB8H047_PSICU|nr:hypothetical protein JR316_0005790 [Psilocybe cubensis]KAH9481268.1 hypothetical protein JR316_0005790 [Psilocybe cubensis]